MIANRERPGCDECNTVLMGWDDDQNSKAHASFGERGPFFTLSRRHQGFAPSVIGLTIAASRAAGLLAAAARLVAALVNVIGLALLAGAALLGGVLLLACAALLGGILIAASTAAGTLSRLLALLVCH